MRPIVSIMLVGSFLMLPGVFTAAPVPWGSVAYAEVSDKELTEQLAEMKMMSKKMMMDATGREKTMKMLMEVTKTLERIESQAP